MQSGPGSAFITSADQQPEDTLAKKVILVNTYYPYDNKYRQKKAEVFERATIELQEDIAKELRHRYTVETVIIPGLLKNTRSDSSLLALMASHQATKAIVLFDFNAWFEQTKVEVEGTKGSKTRTAFYDICAKADYIIYDTNGVIAEVSPFHRHFFTDREVMSGLLAAGPDIVGKKKHVYHIMPLLARELVEKIHVEMMAE